jgi:hypothetical protein
MAQRDAVTKLASVYFNIESSAATFSPKEALRALLGTKPGYSDMQVGVSARYRVGAGSLPPPGPKIPVRSLVSSEMQTLLDSCSDLMRSGEDLSSSLEEMPLECAVDPVLKKGGVSYGRFLASLVDCDVAGRATEVKERTDIFCSQERREDVAAHLRHAEKQRMVHPAARC